MSQFKDAFNLFIDLGLGKNINVDNIQYSTRLKCDQKLKL